ncbi:hypothetical protein ACTXT7_017307, partial [Hymenolepis weldensis]
LDKILLSLSLSLCGILSPFATDSVILLLRQFSPVLTIYAKVTFLVHSLSLSLSLQPQYVQ